MEWFVGIIQDPRTGAAVVLSLWLWFERQGRIEERDERRKTQDQLNQLAERFHTATNAAEKAITAIKDLIQAGARRE